MPGRKGHGDGRQAEIGRTDDTEPAATGRPWSQFPKLRPAAFFSADR